MTIYYVILTALASIAPILFIFTFCGTLDIYMRQPKIYISLIIWFLFAIYANVTIYCFSFINSFAYNCIGVILAIVILADFIYSVSWWLGGKETKDSAYYRALNGQV